MVNRFYVDPLGGQGPQIAQGLGGLASVMKGRRDQQQALERQNMGKAALQSAIQTNDAAALRQVMFDYPELKEQVNSIQALEDQQTRPIVQRAYSRVLADPSGGIGYLEQGALALEQAGLDSTALREDAEMLMQSPEQGLKAIQLGLKAFEPDLYDVYSAQQKTDRGTQTANIADFEYYKRLQKTDPEGATMFAKDTGLIPKDRPMSAQAEKTLIDAQDRYYTTSEQAREYGFLANDFESFAGSLPTGAAATFSEFLKSVTGTQDEATELRRRLNKVRLSEGLKNLPPGPATDRDVAEAYKGVPKENASVEQINAFLRGSEKLAAVEADYQQFKADYISQNDNTRGLIPAWKEAVKNGEIESVKRLYEGREGLPAQQEPMRQQSIDELLRIYGQ